MHAMLIFGVVLIAQADSGVPKRTADAAQDVEKIQFERWQKYYRTVAAEYDMEVGREPKTELQLQPEPVFNWFNPAGGARSHGSMFVWTREGRPEVVGTIWTRQPVPTVQERVTVHSLHSLSLEPITATRRGSVFWSPQSPGIEQILVPDAPEPVASSQLRLTQMRNMAREFSALTMPPGQRDRRLEIRPQPVYRFENPTVERDGAFFIWLDDSDPELVTLLETRATSAGPKWHVSFARFAGTPVMALHKDAKVWSFAESVAEFRRGGPESRYISVHGVDILPAIRDQ
jgi:hypothetical protein